MTRKLSSNEMPNVGTTRPLASALFLGTATGIFGMCAGGAVGILKSAHPGLAAVYTGVQFFVLGSSASLTRDAVLALPLSTERRTHELLASTAAGGISGAAAGRFWARLAFIPGGFLFGTLGYLSQRYVHRSNDRSSHDSGRRPIMQRLAESRWFPIQNISNDDYYEVLTDKLLKLDAEIQVVEDKLQQLKASAEDSPKRDG